MSIQQAKCPRCGSLAPYRGNPDRPFCSEKCRLVDLGNWANEEYRIRGEKTNNQLDQNQEPEG